MTKLISMFSLITLLACSQSEGNRSPQSASMKSEEKTKTDKTDSASEDAKDAEKVDDKSEDLKEDVEGIEKPEMSEEEEKKNEEPQIKDPVIAACYKGDAFICEIEKYIDEETNKLRLSSNKLALVHSGAHSFISRQWSDYQASKTKISHEGFPQDRIAAYKKEFNASAIYLAENVAIITSNKTYAQAIAKQFVTMWWNSAGHKANMLGDFKSLGSGVAKKGNDYYATQLFTK